MNDELRAGIKDERCKDHYFEASQISGVLVYSLDHGPNVQLRFTQRVCLTVFVDRSSDTLNLLEESTEDRDGDESLSAFASTRGKFIFSNDSTSDPQSSIVTMLSSKETDRLKSRKRGRPPGKGKRMSKEECSQSEEISVSRKLRRKTGKQAPEASFASEQTVEELPFKVSPEVEFENKGSCETRDEYSHEDAALKNKIEHAEASATKCKYCHKVFPSLRQYYDHRRAEGSTHQCSICGKVEPFEANLIVHMQRHEHVNVEDEQSEPERTRKSETKSKAKKAGKERMKCNICGLVVSSIDSLKIHTMLHTGESPYRCCVCGDKFSSLSSRQHHMDTHVTVDRFRCVPCNLRFPSRADLARHQLSHQFKCGLCGQEFPNKTSRSCHFRVAHPHDILRCGQCPALFSSAEALERHQHYHSRGQRQQCPTCGLVVSKLKEHMLLHSASPQMRMYVCDQCPMSYLRKSNLERHMRTHTGEKPYACSHCSKRFRSNGMLRKHLLTHTQERPFQCEVCGKRCALRSNLAVHMRVHSTQRRFSCQLCGQSFNHKNSLQGHVQSKHSKLSPSPAALPCPEPLTDALGIPTSAESGNTMSSTQMSSLPQPQAETGSMQLPPPSSMHVLSNLALPAVIDGRPDYTQLVQMGYSTCMSNPIEDQTNIIASHSHSHPQPGLSLNYPNG